MTDEEVTAEVERLVKRTKLVTTATPGMGQMLDSLGVLMAEGLLTLRRIATALERGVDGK